MNLDLHLDDDERQALAALEHLVLTALAFVFLALLLIEFTANLSPAESRWVSLAGWIIWAIFTADFVGRFAFADAKLDFLRANWLSALAVLLPAFRVFRIFETVRAIRSLRLIRAVAGTNRGARALRRIGGFAGVGYVLVLTILVIVLGAGGIAWLERGQPRATITSFWDGLWWAATTVIQQGSQQAPVTPEGRVLAVLLMIYSLGITGYVAGALATLLIGRRRQQNTDDITVLREEIRALRRDLARHQGLPPGASEG
jgi:voltage-gated potassium channel